MVLDSDLAAPLGSSGSPRASIDHASGVAAPGGGLRFLRLHAIVDDGTLADG